ncbi:MAG TPA: EAL domain-containing protein, partial [Rhodocyclaceae bacterium]|nr:EAL domain-containing protein [Rhodocyclaceae bacterium]
NPLTSACSDKEKTMLPAHQSPFTVTDQGLSVPALTEMNSQLGQPGQLAQLGERREVIGEWYGCKLSSVFQPIVDPVSGRQVGSEAFLRCHGNGQRDLSPWSLFSANASDEKLVAFDRLVRTVHTVNFRAHFEPGQLLFLNIHGRLLAAVNADHGAYFRGTLASLGIAPEQVVIETPTAASHQTELLSFVLRNYRNNGFRVAVNVDSAAQWQLIASRIDPDFVKIDARAVLDGAAGGSGGLDWLHALKGDATLVLTHLESRLGDDQLRSGTWAQGFAYGRPAPRLAAPETAAANRRFLRC